MRLGTQRRTTAARERAELETLRAVVAELRRVCEAAVEGDSEARVRRLDGTDSLPDVLALRSALNGTLDRTDAFVREAAEALDSIASGRFHRRVLLAGMRGPLRRGAVQINTARLAMIESEQRTAAADAQREALADQLELTVMSIAEQVAAASTELSATAAGLAGSAAHAVDRAEDASGTVAQLDTASRQIVDVVALISNVAEQTKLLALNATIEAARAGDAGRGFGVVASEVKSLADTTARSTEEITGHVQSMLTVADRSRSAMTSIEDTVRDMTPMVDALITAVDGTAPAGRTSFDESTFLGLAQMAETLRGEVGSLLVAMRAG